MLQNTLLPGVYLKIIGKAKVKRLQSAVYRHSAALTRQTGFMAADNVAVGAASPHRSALGRAQGVERSCPDKTACQGSPSLTASEQRLLPHMQTLTNAQQPFTDYVRAVNVLASSRGRVELKRLLPSSKRDDCLRVLKRLLDNLSDYEAIKDTLRVLFSLQYDETQLWASRLGPVLQSLSQAVEEVAAEPQEVAAESQEVAAEPQEMLQQYHGVSRSVFGRQLYLSEECQALSVHCA